MFSSPFFPPSYVVKQEEKGLLAGSNAYKCCMQQMQIKLTFEHSKQIKSDVLTPVNCAVLPQTALHYVM